MELSLSTCERCLAEALCAIALLMLPPSSLQKHTELCDRVTVTGWLNLLQGWGGKLGSWCGRVKHGMMSKGWVLVEDDEVGAVPLRRD